MSKGIGFLSHYIRDSRNHQAALHVTGKRVLDVGCNTGYLRTILPKDVEYVGIDVHKLPGIDFTFYERSVNDDLKDLGKFDTIFMLATIEHLENYHTAIANLVPLLNEGGVLILTTPTQLGDSLHHWGARVGLTSQMAAEDHEKIFNGEELNRLLTSCGLNVVASHRFFWGMNQLAVGKKIKTN